MADPEFEEKEEGSNDKRSPVARKCAAEMQEAGTWAKIELAEERIRYGSYAFAVFA